MSPMLRNTMASRNTFLSRTETKILNLCIKLKKAKEEAEEAFTNISEVSKKELSRYNRQRVLSLQASLIQYAESRLKNGRDTYAILAKLLNDLKKSS